MAARVKEFDFSMPVVKRVPSQSVKKVVAVGKSSVEPTKALKLLMAGKLFSKPKR
jgi:hypothetical protein